MSSPTISPRRCGARSCSASARTASTRRASRSAPPSIRACRRSPTACCASTWSPMTRPRAIAARCSMSTASRTGRRRCEALPPMPWLYSWQPAIVTRGDQGDRHDRLQGRHRPARSRSPSLGWAHLRSPEGRLGPARQARPPTSCKVGDIIAVEPLVEDGNAIPTARYALRQIPEVSGAHGGDGSAYRPRPGDDRRLVAISRSRVQPRHPGASASRARPSSRSSIWRRWKPASRRRP